MPKDVAVHLNPIWRSRADFIVMARLEGEALEGRSEQLWARQLDENRFEICCIPFFVHDVDLGDHVEATLDDEGTYVIRRVVRKSGYYTFRAWFGDTDGNASPEEVVNWMKELGCLCEWYSENLLGLAATSEEQARDVAEYLSEQEASGRLDYETGRT